MTIQSPNAIEHPPTIQSGSTIQSPNDIQHPLTIRSALSIQELSTEDALSTAEARLARIPKHLRSVVSSEIATNMHDNATQRRDLIRELRTAEMTKVFSRFGVALPENNYPMSREGATSMKFRLNKPLQRALSDLARRSALSLPDFVELVRGQTAADYRPNKNMEPSVLENVCKGYRHLDLLQNIVRKGVEVHLKESPPKQSVRPPNHGSASERINILRKNIRKEQEAWRCVVLDADLLEQWPEIIISPFGVVDKGGEDSTVSGRTIHDLSYLEGASVNDYTDQNSINKPDYTHCDAVSREILKAKKLFPGTKIAVMAGDVATAFRNTSIHSNSVYLFAGRMEEEDAIVIELCAPFGWTGSPRFYEIFGGAIFHVHGSHTNAVSPNGFFAYHWVDDHINVTPDIGSSCCEMDRSLRYAMVTVLGADAINTEKFTGWSTRQRVLGLEFDSEAGEVALPDTKISKARRIVASAFHAKTLSRKEYRSLLGSLRHVATCVRAARPFLQRLRQQEGHLHRFQNVLVSDDMKSDLLWWWLILHTPQLNDMSLEFFNTLPSPDIVVEMDASDYGLCALDPAAKEALTHAFTVSERQLITEFNRGVPNGFDINYRELLSCAFAVHAWGPRWSKRSSHQVRPTHVHFRIDNSSAVAWQNKLASRNPRAQVIIRLLSWWETSLGLRFSASHIAGADNVRADAGSRSSANPSLAALFESLTLGWLQVSPAVDVQGLTNIWLRISAHTPLPAPPSTNTGGH